MRTTSAPPRRTEPLRAARADDAQSDDAGLDDAGRTPTTTRPHPPVAHLTDRIDALIADGVPAEIEPDEPGRLRSAAVFVLSSMSVGSLMYWMVLLFR